MDAGQLLVKYDARLRDTVAADVVQEVTDTVQASVPRPHPPPLTHMRARRTRPQLIEQVH